MAKTTKATKASKQVKTTVEFFDSPKRTKQYFKKVIKELDAIANKKDTTDQDIAKEIKRGNLDARLAKAHKTFEENRLAIKEKNAKNKSDIAPWDADEFLKEEKINSNFLTLWAAKCKRDADAYRASKA